MSQVQSFVKMAFGQRLLVVIIIALFMIPGACAINIGGGSSISVGDLSSASGVVVVNRDDANGYSLANGLVSDTESHWVKDTTGKLVQVDMSVANAAELAYKFSLSPNSDKKTVSSRSYLTAQEWLDVTDADTIQASAAASNHEGDKACAIINIEDGSLSNYQNYAKATNTKATASQSADSLSGSTIELASGSQNKEGDMAWAVLAATTGTVSGYSDDASAAKKAVSSSISIDSATGKLIDVQSHAIDKAYANEYLSYSNGKVLYIPTYYGAADFEVQAAELTETKLVTSATSNNVVITPTLPSSIKTAIMLEPFNKAFTYAGATDLGTTVFPDLVNIGYATTRYTDSGASSDKFQNLGSYNVVLVDSHMDSSNIGLSTGSGYISASKLKYDTSEDSLVILAGCTSFGGYPTASKLAKAVSDADIFGGYANSVGTVWNNDYLSYFFDSLSNGATASSANAYAYATATEKYGSSSIYLPLVFYGDQEHKL